MKTNRLKINQARCVASLLGLGITLSLAGCYAGSGGVGVAYSTPGGAVVAEDSYDYYPGYEVYYNRTRNHYYYREGDHWVTRPKPPGSWAKGAPSVHMDFHDAPERHHAEIARQYPKTWQPAPAAPHAEPPPEHREQH